MKKWLIKKLGGYTQDEMKYIVNDQDNQTQIDILSKAIAELVDLKYFMEDNYGTNWSGELYQKVLNRIVELQDEIDNHK